MDILKQQMEMDMELRGLSKCTCKTYLKQMHHFVRHFKKSPLEMTEKEIREYLHYLTHDKKLSHSYVNCAYSALKFFYTTTLDREWDIRKLPRLKKERKLPIVLSPKEINTIFEVITNLKHKAILMTIYSAGLRVSEAAHLKVSDIDSQRMQIRIRSGKGNKDRYCMLSQTLLEVLRRYWYAYQPSDWLFPSIEKDQPLSTRSIQRVFKQSLEQAGIHKKASVHTLRHSFATHLLELGTDIYSIQKLMGHSNIKTTSIYIHVQEQKVLNIISPLDRIQDSANA